MGDTVGPHIGVDPIGDAPQRQFPQGSRVAAPEEILPRTLYRLADRPYPRSCAPAGHRAADRRDDVGRCVKDAVGNGLPHPNPDDATDDIIQGLSRC